MKKILKPIAIISALLIINFHNLTALALPNCSELNNCQNFACFSDADCSNAGTCYLGKSESSYCTCVSGYTGTNCQAFAGCDSSCVFPNGICQSFSPQTESFLGWMSGCFCLATDESIAFDLPDGSCPHMTALLRTNDSSETNKAFPISNGFTGTWAGEIPSTGSIKEDVIFQICVKSHSKIEAAANSAGILNKAKLQTFYSVNNDQLFTTFKNSLDKDISVILVLKKDINKLNLLAVLPDSRIVTLNRIDRFSACEIAKRKNIPSIPDGGIIPE